MEALVKKVFTEQPRASLARCAEGGELEAQPALSGKGG